MTNVKGFGDTTDISNNLLDTRLQGLFYHGSNCVVKEPKIIKGKYTKDFGYGFYLTNSEQQAVKFTRKFDKKVINLYRLTNTDGLTKKIFTEMDDNWLDFISHYRNGGTHNYDIVEGPMADDQVWNFVSRYFRGNISRDEMFEKARFLYPTHQLCLCSEKAIKRILFTESFEVVSRGK